MAFNKIYIYIISLDELYFIVNHVLLKKNKNK